MSAEVRSLLFVPGDRRERFAKAMASAADALIIDLEDSVAEANKDVARNAVADYLAQPREKPVLVRINPLCSAHVKSDMRLVRGSVPDAIVLPKSESAADVEQLVDLVAPKVIPILPIATETAASVFGLSSYKEVAPHLFGLTWGAEDLPAAIGAISSREENGTYTPPYEWARAQMLFAAHAATASAIETVYPDLENLSGLATYAARGRRDGFTAMLALHPKQCEIINHAFTPTEAEIAYARKVASAFVENPGAGVLKIDGKMLDRPHLKQALNTISLAEALENKEG